MTDGVELTVVDAVARLRLNRPEAGNAFDPAHAAAFRDRASEIAGRDDVRAVLLCAAGDSFCVGGDLDFIAQQTSSVTEAVHALATDVHAGILALAEVDGPVVAAVTGVAAGVGLSLVCGADLVVAASDARFVMAFAAAGLSPDGGATWLLPQLIGYRRAIALALTNRHLTALEAMEIGIVTRVVERDQLDDDALKLARTLASGPTRAFGRTKRLMRSATSATFAEQLELEATSIAELAAEPDGREGVTAFLQKRRPTFVGGATG